MLIRNRGGPFSKFVLSAQASGADISLASTSILGNGHFLYVGAKAPLGFVKRARDIVTRHRSLAADFALGHCQFVLSLHNISGTRISSRDRPVSYHMTGNFANEEAQ